MADLGTRFTCDLGVGLDVGQALRGAIIPRTANLGSRRSQDTTVQFYAYEKSYAVAEDSVCLSRRPKLMPGLSMP
jgi:hypothetical protein